MVKKKTPETRQRRTGGPTDCLLVVRILLLRGLGQPSQERLGSLANLLGGGEIDVLLASLGTPLRDDLLAEQVVRIVQLKDLNDLVIGLRVLLGKVADEAFGTAQKSPLVTLGCDELLYEVSTVVQ